MAKNKTINHLSDEEKFCLDAYVINKNADLAYLLSRKNDSDANGDSLHRQALRWLRETHVKAYVDERTTVIFSQLEKTGDMAKEDVKSLVEKYKDKDYIIAELIKALTGLQGKERADVLNRIADLQQMKKEETKNEEERVHYYLPLPICKTCKDRHKLGDGS